MSEHLTLRVVMAQINLTVGDVSGNVKRILSACDAARERLGAHVVLFPELALSGYPPEDLLLRPTFLSQCEDGLALLRDGVRGVAAVVGHPHRESGRLYNAASVIVDGRIEATYRKQLLPNYGVFDERRYFVPGQAPCVVTLRGMALGITICEDVWEAGPAAQVAEAGARAILNLNASPYHRGKTHERVAVLRQRVMEAACPIVYVNLVGGQDELVFDGGSCVVDADGVLGLRGEFCEEGLYPVDLEQHAGEVVVVPGEQRPIPADDDAVYRALVLGTRDYVHKNGFPGVVLGLSGGIDSALTLAVAVDALGPERVMAVSMPSRYTSEMSNVDARQQAAAMGVQYTVLPIETCYRAFIETLTPVFVGRPPDTTEENIQARCRGVLLMAISNKTGRMVLTTSNKSETAVGYSTLYGDMAGGFSPIKDVPKTLVYRLARFRNGSTPVIPQRVIERPPSAELRENQLDQDSLPPYEVLDPILEMYVEQDRSVDEIVAHGFDREVVERVARLVIASEYKRRQAAPGVRITPRAFGRDRRYPITSGFRR